MKLEFYRQIFEKSSNIKFHENPSSGRRVVPYGQTDRRDEANSRFSQFCERASKGTTRSLLWIGTSKLLENWNRYSSRTAYCSMSWRVKKNKLKRQLSSQCFCRGKRTKKKKLLNQCFLRGRSTIYMFSIFAACLRIEPPRNATQEYPWSTP